MMDTVDCQYVDDKFKFLTPTQITRAVTIQAVPFYSTPAALDLGLLPGRRIAADLPSLCLCICSQSRDATSTYLHRDL